MVAGLVGSGGGGLTPLVFAAREGDIESAKLLLDAGAPVNDTTEYGWTPLLTAVNNRDMVALVRSVVAATAAGIRGGSPA